MRDFRSGNRSRDRGFGPRRPVTMHDAVCDECGKPCQLPFKPTNGKPIYCSECFEKKGGRSENRSRDRGSFSGRGSFGGRDNRDRYNPAPRSQSDMTPVTEKIEALNVKLDKIIELLSATGTKKPKVKKVEAAPVMTAPENPEPQE